MAQRNWKAEHDAAQRIVAAKNLRIRELEEQTEALRVAHDTANTRARIGLEIRSLAVLVQENLRHTGEVVEARLETLEKAEAITEQNASLRRDLDAANLRAAELDHAAEIARQAQQDAERRLHLAERAEAQMFHNLTKRLPKGWEGRSIRDLLRFPEGQGGLNGMVAEALDWCNERARLRIPTEITEVDVVEVPEPPAPAEPPALPPEAPVDEQFPDGPGAEDMLAEIEALSPAVTVRDESNGSVTLVEG